MHKLFNNATVTPLNQVDELYNHFVELLYQIVNFKSVQSFCATADKIILCQKTSCLNLPLLGDGDIIGISVIYTWGHC